MNIKSIVTFVVVTVLVLVGSVTFLWKFGNAGNKEVVVEGVAGEARLFRGEGEIEVVEFSDFQCPACQAVVEPLEQILSKYEGKVKFVYRYFPLTNIHKNAFLAAQAAEAANNQNKFWEMHDKLFEKQTDWENLENPSEMFQNYASEMGLDSAKFMTDLDSQEVKDAVNNDFAAATRFNLRGTPTFFVNGVETNFGQLESKLSELSK